MYNTNNKDIDISFILGNLTSELFFCNVTSLPFCGFEFDAFVRPSCVNDWEVLNHWNSINVSVSVAFFQVGPLKQQSQSGSTETERKIWRNDGFEPFKFVRPEHSHLNLLSMMYNQRDQMVLLSIIFRNNDAKRQQQVKLLLFASSLRK